MRPRHRAHPGSRRRSRGPCRRSASDRGHCGDRPRRCCEQCYSPHVQLGLRPPGCTAEAEPRRAAVHESDPEQLCTLPTLLELLVLSLYLSKERPPADDLRDWATPVATVPRRTRDGRSRPPRVFATPLFFAARVSAI